MECAICHATVADTEAAIAAGWHPCHQFGDVQYDDPICAGCCNRVEWIDGEPTLLADRKTWKRATA